MSDDDARNTDNSPIYPDERVLWFFARWKIFAVTIELSSEDSVEVARDP